MAGEKILIVEDNPMNLELATDLLAAGCAGYITKPIDTRAFPKMVTRFIESAGVP